MLCFQCGTAIGADDSKCPNCQAELKTNRKLELSNSRGLRISQQLKAIRLEEQLFKPGEEIAGRFVLAEMLGKGPLGEVYRANDSLIDADVAVKVFDKETLRTPIDQEKFTTAMKKARNATHENLVRIHDSGVHKDHPWVSMQFLEGLSLRKVLDLRKSKGEKFTIDELEPVVAQVTLALQKTQTQHPHGDLKPENIIFLPDMLKVTDSFAFGSLPREVLAERLQTSKYLAPELLEGSAEARASVDVYSLGMIVGEMLFGSDYVPGTQTYGSLSAFDALLKRATAFDPKERYKDPEAFAEALSILVDTRAVRKPTPPPLKVATKAPPPAPLGSASEVSEVSEVSEAIASPPASSESADFVAVSSDDLPTVEYDRQLEEEIQDFLPTTEVGRTKTSSETDEVPARKDPKKEKTESVPVPKGRAEQKKKDDGFPFGAIAAATVVGILGVVILMAIAGVFNKSEEVVDLSDAKAKEIKPKEDAPKEVVQTPPTHSERDIQTSVTQAALGFVAARNAAELALTAPKEMNPFETKNNANPKDGDPKEKIAAVDKPTEVEKPAGTKCPSGSTLVKRKWGNYCVDRYEYPGRGAKPKTRVSWFNAKKTCESKGKRLCTIKEWRSACGAKYPYGKKFNANNCNTTDEDGFERTIAKAGAFKKCKSRSSGAYDMTGNVHEWVKEQKIAGGGFESDEAVASCRYASSKSPGSSAGYIGFRCCADPQ